MILAQALVTLRLLCLLGAICDLSLLPFLWLLDRLALVVVKIFLFDLHSGPDTTVYRRR